MMAGLKEMPPEDKSSCTECVDFGILVGQMQSSVYTLEFKRNEWINLSALNRMSTKDKFDALLELYYPVQKLTRAALGVMMNKNMRALLGVFVETVMF